MVVVVVVVVAVYLFLLALRALGISGPQLAVLLSVQQVLKLLHYIRLHFFVIVHRLHVDFAAVLNLHSQRCINVINQLFLEEKKAEFSKKGKKD